MEDQLRVVMSICLLYNWRGPGTEWTGDFWLKSINLGFLDKLAGFPRQAFLCWGTSQLCILWELKERRLSKSDFFCVVKIYLHEVLRRVLH